MINLKNIHLSVIMIVWACGFAGVSCGYFTDKPLENSDVYTASELASNCTIDIDRLSRILDEDVELQLKCLRDNFKQFIQYVRTDNNDAVSRSELEQFIHKFFHHNSQSIVGALGILFELNMLFLQDEMSSISHNNITPLFNLIIKANKEAIIITQVFGKIKDDGNDGNTDNQNFWTLREKLKLSIERFSNYTINIIAQKISTNSNLPFLNLKDFINNLNERLPQLGSDSSFNPESVNKFLFIKKLFLGGESDIITAPEAQTLIEKAPKAILLAFDLIFSSEKHFKNDKHQYLNYLVSSLSTLNDLIYPHKDDEHIFNMDDIYPPNIDQKEIGQQDDELEFEKYREIIDIIKTHLIGGDRNQYFISDIKSAIALSNIALEIIKVQGHYQNFKNSPLSFGEKKQKLISSFFEFGDMATVLLMDKYILKKDINISSFLQEINPHFDILKFPPEVLEAMISVKPIFFLGEKNILTKEELKTSLLKIPDILALLLEIVEGENPKENLSKVISEHKHIIDNLFYDLPLDFKIASFDELLTLAEYFFKKELKQFKPSIINLKKRLLYKGPGQNEDFLFGDLKILKNIFMGVYERLYFFDVTYDAHKIQMESNRLFTSFNSDPNIEAYRFFKKEDIRKYTREILHITSRYRFFRSSDSGVSYMGPLIKRTKEGLKEIAVLRHLIQKLISAYTNELPNISLEGSRIGPNEVNTFLYEVKDILQEFGLWSENPTTFARNTILMADLFQTQSNGDGLLGVDETTEYIGTILTAGKMTEALKQKISMICPTDFNGEFGVMIHCLKPYFFSIWLEHNGMDKYLPKLYFYIKASSLPDVQNFFINVAGFARDTNDPQIPMSERELMLLVGALINIESTYIRFDENHNNIIDNNELDLAFLLYRNWVMELANLTPSSNKYAKSIFLYMVKYMKVPDTLDLMLFHYNPFVSHSDITAGRLNIGALLYYLVN